MVVIMHDIPAMRVFNFVGYALGGETLLDALRKEKGRT